MSGYQWKRHWQGLFWGMIVAIAASTSARLHAQIDVDFKLAKSTYIAHEPVVGVLSIVNRAGRDLVLSGKNGQSWLDFRVVDGQGRMVTPSANALPPKPIILKAGQLYKKNVVINQTYPMGRIGLYRVKPTVNLSQINRVFTTAKNVTATIVEGQKMWEQTFGVPPGYDGEGTFREYALVTQHQGNRQKSLYLKLTDVSSGLVRKVYPIGDYMGIRPPEKIVNRENKLHVFHMSGPKSFVYSIIGVDGVPIEQQVYVVKGSSTPSMVTNAAGDIAVIGGMTLEESRETYESREFRNISERPPGLPNL